MVDVSGLLPEPSGYTELLEQSASLEAPRRVHAYGIDAGRPVMTRNLRDASVNCTLGTRPGRSRGFASAQAIEGDSRGSS